MGGYILKDCISSLMAIKLAKKPIIATEAKRINCLEGDVFDSVNTKYRVIKKFTNTPKENEIANESVEFRIVKDKTPYVFCSNRL
jgi:hypothetical protein